jgi:hypothetical protein
MTKSNIKPFLIVGYPRSKTAWLSNYFTSNGIRCYHELSLDYKEDQIGIILDDCHGNSDSGLAFMSDWVIRQVNSGKMRILFVDRPKSEVLESLSKAYKEEGINVPNLEFIIELFNFNIKNIKLSVYGVCPDRMDVQYSEIFDNIEQIHSFLTPQIPFCQARFEMMKYLKVTQTISKRLEQADPNAKFD